MSEQFYDTEIAPKLMEICKACQDRGIPFSATVEYEPDQRAETRFLPDDSSLPMFMLAWLNHHGSNVDGFMIDLLRHCRRKGIDWNSSLVLRKLGGEYSPEETRVGTNSGHGHVWERPDGMKARCGGPGMCAVCSADAALNR